MSLSPTLPDDQALLPWESPEAWTTLLDSYQSNYLPEGPSERMLVTQLAWIDWRRQRLLIGERALHMACLNQRTSDKQFDGLCKRAVLKADAGRPHIDSIEASTTGTDDDDDDMSVLLASLAAAEKAEKILSAGGPDAYGQTMASLDEVSLEWWRDEHEVDPETYPANAEGLLRFIRDDALVWIRSRLQGVKLRPLIRLQAWGESLDPDRMDRLLQLDERMTRQYEKILGLLMKVQGTRLRTVAK